MQCPKEPLVGGPRLVEILIEMEERGASGEKIYKCERPTHASFVSAIFLVYNLDTPGAIIKNATNCMDVDSWLSGQTVCSILFRS